jgi:hypothetical protein
MHVMARNTGIEDTRRTFDEMFFIGDEPMFMSDQFGVRATITYGP